jgi:hypothetical protein
MRLTLTNHWQRLSDSPAHLRSLPPGEDGAGVDLISDVLPFGRLWYRDRMQSAMRNLSAGHTMP